MKPFELEKVVELQNRFLREKNGNYIYPVLTNINTYMAQLSGDMNCFTVVENYENVNMHPPQFLVILRFTGPYVIREISAGVLVTYRVIFGPSTNPWKNQTNYDNFSCAPLLATNLGLDYCVVNFTKFSLHSKPSTCVIHLGIFPPLYMNPFEKFSYPRIFNFQLIKRYREAHTPSSILQINAMVMLANPSTSNQWTSVSTSKWVESTLLTSPYMYINDVIIILSASSAPLAELHSPDTSCIITAIDILKICPGCEDENKLGTIVRIPVQNLELKKLENLAFVAPTERLIWFAYSFVMGDGILLDRVIQHAKSTTSVSFEELWTSIFSTESLLGNVAIAHATVWKSVMRNYTFLGDDKYKLHQIRLNLAIIVEYRKYRSSLSVFPNYSPNIIQSLRFVGCGKQGMSSIPFQELTNIFDKLIWLGIILTMLVIPKLLQQQLQNSNLTCHIFSVLKIFLEHGNPFQQSVENTNRIRYMIGVLLLMGIILSNAYKNTNVYNMVIPRKPILYEYLEELVRDQFEILARPSNVPIFVRRDFDFLERLDVRIASRKTYLLSEVMSTLQARRRNSSEKEGGKIRTRTELNNAVLKAAKLRQEVAAIFLNSLRKENATQLTEPISAQIKLSQNFPAKQLLETERLLGIVENCQKTAVVLPDHISRKFYSASKLPHVFIGQETYSDNDWKFYLKGIVPPYLIRRIHHIAESGVWQWWMQLLSGGNTKRQNVDYVKPGSLDGNVVIIFAVWGIGLMFSILWHAVKFQNCVFEFTHAKVRRICRVLATQLNCIHC